MILTLDPRRVEEFVARNDARFGMFERVARPTGIPVPMPTDDKQIEAVDMYCLDAASLLRYARVERARIEQIVFALLGFTAEDYATANGALDAELGALATEVPPPSVDEVASQDDCG